MSEKMKLLTYADFLLARADELEDKDDSTSRAIYKLLIADIENILDKVRKL